MPRVSELTSLAVQPSAKTLGHYRVKRAWIVEIDGRAFTVPANFEFDGDSVPRLPFVYLLTKGRSGLKAPCLHDWLYFKQPVTRRQADKIYLIMMRHYGVRWVWRSLHYIGVRIGGWIGWRRHARRKAQGGKR